MKDLATWQAAPMRTRLPASVAVAAMVVLVATGCGGVTQPQPSSSADPSGAPSESASVTPSAEPSSSPDGDPIGGSFMTGWETTVVSAQLGATPRTALLPSPNPGETYLAVRYSALNVGDSADDLTRATPLLYLDREGEAPGLQSVVSDDLSESIGGGVQPGGSIEFSAFYAVPDTTTLEAATVCNDLVFADWDANFECAALA